jgi:hypothetical protein
VEGGVGVRIAAVVLLGVEAEEGGDEDEDEVVLVVEEAAQTVGKAEGQSNSQIQYSLFRPQWSRISHSLVEDYRRNLIG